MSGKQHKRKTSGGSDEEEVSGWAAAVGAATAMWARPETKLERDFNSDFNSARAEVLQRFQDIHDQEITGVQSWYGAPSDPPKKEFNFLAAVLEAMAGLALGPLGKFLAGKIAGKVTAGLADRTVSVVELALKEGASEGSKAASEKLGDAVKGSSGSNHAQEVSMHAFYEASRKHVDESKWGRRREMSKFLSGRSGSDADWEILQAVDDALGEASSFAMENQFNAMTDGWFAELAKSEFGEDDDGTISASGLADDWATSSLGTLGLHLNESMDPSGPATVKYAEIEGSAGNTAPVRNRILDRPLDELRFPRVIIAENMSTPKMWDQDLVGGFSIGVDRDGNWVSREYTGLIKPDYEEEENVPKDQGFDPEMILKAQAVKSTSGEYRDQDPEDYYRSGLLGSTRVERHNVGEVWLAAHGAGTSDVSPDSVSDSDVKKGARRLMDTLVHSKLTLRMLGVKLHT